MAEKQKLPGGRIAARPLHFILILDCSGSMSIDGKIQELNFAIKESIPAMQQAAGENPNAEVLVRAVTFSDGANWHIDQPTAVNDFKWADVHAPDGVTDMGHALTLVAEALRIPPMTDRALPPVLVLVSDGQPTDDFATGLHALNAEPWGKKAVRIAIGVGRDADFGPLQEFLGTPERQPLRASNAPTLVKYIKWASTAVLQAASQPPSVPQDAQGKDNVPVPEAPPSDDAAGEVW